MTKTLLAILLLLPLFSHSISVNGAERALHGKTLVCDANFQMYDVDGLTPLANKTGIWFEFDTVKIRWVVRQNNRYTTREMKYGYSEEVNYITWGSSKLDRKTLILTEGMNSIKKRCELTGDSQSVTDQLSAEIARVEKLLADKIKTRGNKI